MKTIREISKMLTTNTDNSLLSIEDILLMWSNEIIDRCEQEVTTWDSIEYEEPGALVEKLKEDVLSVKELL